MTTRYFIVGPTQHFRHLIGNAFGLPAMQRRYVNRESGLRGLSSRDPIVILAYIGADMYSVCTTDECGNHIEMLKEVAILRTKNVPVLEITDKML